MTYIQGVPPGIKVDRERRRLAFQPTCPTVHGPIRVRDDVDLEAVLHGGLVRVVVSVHVEDHFDFGGWVKRKLFLVPADPPPFMLGHNPSLASGEGLLEGDAKDLPKVVQEGGRNPSNASGDRLQELGVGCGPITTSSTPVSTVPWSTVLGPITAEEAWRAARRKQRSMVLQGILTRDKEGRVHRIYVLRPYLIEDPQSDVPLVEGRLVYSIDGVKQDGDPWDLADIDHQSRGWAVSGIWRRDPGLMSMQAKLLDLTVEQLEDRLNRRWRAYTKKERA